MIFAKQNGCRTKRKVLLVRSARTHSVNLVWKKGLKRSHLFVMQFIEELQQQRIQKKRNIETLNGEVLLSFMEILFQIWKLDPNKLKSPSETGSEIGEEISSEKI